MAYLNTGKYNEAIDYLNKFKSDDIVLSGLATGAIGDAYADNKPEEALKNYVKAAGINKMILLHPFLVKSWKDSFGFR
jgi:tetratricopeptide (TPR) repeat protein